MALALLGFVGQTDGADDKGTSPAALLELLAADLWYFEKVFTNRPREAVGEELGGLVTDRGSKSIIVSMHRVSFGKF